MKSLWAPAVLGTALLGHSGGARAEAPFMREAMAGGRVTGFAVGGGEPDWTPAFNDESKPHEGVQLRPSAEWKIECSSTSSARDEGEEDDAHACEHAIDGRRGTAWRSAADGREHVVTVELPVPHNINAVVVLPPEEAGSVGDGDVDGEGAGLIMEHEILVSADGRSWGRPVAYGMWPDTNRQRMGVFEPVSARFVRLVAKPSSSDPKKSSKSWHGIAELALYATSFVTPADPKKGAWGPTLDLPVVPVSGAQEASGHIVLWSSWANDQFHATPGGSTAMSRWQPRTGAVSKRIVNSTQHDMFCPGIAIDGTGMMVVTGGNDASQTSLYDGARDRWETGPPMGLRRGYQASTTLSDGRVFVIGGSWAGGSNVPKDGEVYDPFTRRWTPLPGALVRPMLTDDMEGAWRADNHGWLFGWKNATVFQGGPSRAMNWYFTDGERGGVAPAGHRLDDEDSMSGNAVMFDAVAGKILTLGGSPDYDKSWASRAAHIITLGEPGERPRVERAARRSGQMRTERVFHTSVVLPDGTVFVAGGQEFGVAFNEENARFVPEIYDPARDAFTELARNNVIRVYHSISILLPDARVLNAGGGLCGNCSANHYDGQVFTPPYLLDKDGRERRRPVLETDLPAEVPAGHRLAFRASRGVKHASLVRLCSATHTVNTDQRRVPLDVVPVPGAAREYEVTLPSDPGVLIPGYWMFFIMDRYGTPSVAQTIMVKTDSIRKLELAAAAAEGATVAAHQGEEAADSMDGPKDLRSAAKLHSSPSSSSGERGPLSLCWKIWKSAFIQQMLGRE